MPLVVVGGHARKVGKTSVACRLLESLRDRNWTALKVSAARAGQCPVNGSGCDCGVGQHRLVVREEPRASNANDTARFLAAGAERSFWVRAKNGCLAEAVPFIVDRLQGGRFVLAEGTGIVRQLDPDVFVMVLRDDVDDFKESAREVLDRVSCAVLVRTGAVPPAWMREAMDRLQTAPRFEVNAADFRSPGLVRLVSGRLVASGAGNAGPGGVNS